MCLYEVSNEQFLSETPYCGPSSAEDKSQGLPFHRQESLRPAPQQTVPFPYNLHIINGRTIIKSNKIYIIISSFCSYPTLYNHLLSRRFLKQRSYGPSFKFAHLNKKLLI